MNLPILQWHSLKTRMVGFTLAVFCLSIWLLTFYASRVLREDTQRLLSDQQMSTASFVAAVLNDNLGDRFRALEKLAETLSPDILDNKAHLQSVLQGHPFTLDLFNAGVMVVNPEGTAIADLPLWAARTDLNFMDRDYVFQALKHGQATVGRPVISKKLGVPSLNMAVPIRDPQGRVVGAVVGLTRLDQPNFLDRIAHGQYGKTGGMLVASRQHRIIITASDAGRVMEAFPAPGVEELIDQRVQGLEGTGVFVNPRGVEVLSSAKTVPAADWFVVVSLPTQEAYAPIRDVQRRLMAGALLLTVVAGALSWWMVRRQLSPLFETIKALTSMAASNQNLQSLPVARPDEIGQLIAGFNHLLSTLGQREALIRQILNTSSVAIFLVDLQGRITQANQRMAEMFGYRVEELVGRDYVGLVDPAEREVARQKMLDLLASAIPEVNSDRLYWRVDHTEFWGHLSGKRFVDAEGRDQGLIGVISDITERKSVQDKLSRHDAMLASIIENFPGGISMIDADLVMVAHNKQFMQLLDFPESLFENPVLRLEDVFRFNAQRGEYGPGDVDEQVAERIERARKFEPHRFERVRPDGTVLEIHGEPVPGGGFVTIYLDVTERKRMEEQVHQLAFFDPLTKLPNRRLLYDRLSQCLAASKRSGCYGALLFLDLDNFKALNDEHGHGAGDLLLIEVAMRLRNCVREIDTVARLGGDEFVVVVGALSPDKAQSLEQAKAIAEKICTALAAPHQLLIKHDGLADETVAYQCTASLGGVVLKDGEGTQEDFLRWADAAMYQAKAAGSSLIRFHGCGP